MPGEDDTTEEQATGWPRSWDTDTAGARIYEAYHGYPWMSSRLAALIAETAFRLDANPFLLANVIRNESQFNPQAQNLLGPPVDPVAHTYVFRDDPNQHTGLIQFSSNRAREYGTSHRALFAMTPEQQMPYVEKYLASFRPIDTAQRLYLAIFYPDYQNMAADTEFPPIVVRFNPDKRTPQDYIDAVDKYARLLEDGTPRTSVTHRGMYRRAAPVFTFPNATVGGSMSATRQARAFVNALRTLGTEPLRGPHDAGADRGIGVTVRASDAQEAMAAVRLTPGATMDQDADGTITFSWRDLPGSADLVGAERADLVTALGYDFVERFGFQP